MSVKRAISHSVVVKIGLIIVKNGLIVVKNGLILVQKPGKCGFFNFPLQPPEPDLIYDEAYRGGDKK